MRTLACKTFWDFNSYFSYTGDQKAVEICQKNKWRKREKAFGKAVIHSLSWQGEPSSGDARSRALRLSVCLFLILIGNVILNSKTFLTKVSTTDIDFLEKFWFQWNSIFWWKTFNWKVPIQLLFWHPLQALQVCRQWIRKKQCSKHFILPFILFKLQKTVTYDSNYIFYIFGIILNDKP